MARPGITCPACGLVLALHRDGKCPTDSFEEAMAALDEVNDGGLALGDLPGTFIELLTLRSIDDEDALVERLCDFSSIDLAILMRTAMGVVHGFIKHFADEQDVSVASMIQRIALTIAV